MEETIKINASSFFFSTLRWKINGKIYTHTGQFRYNQSTGEIEHDFVLNKKKYLITHKIQ